MTLNQESRAFFWRIMEEAAMNRTMAFELGDEVLWHKHDAQWRIARNQWDRNAKE